jgi:hypothetical protein
MSLARDIADLASVTARLDTVGASEGALGNKNLIINGGMQVWQRATSATAISNSTYGTVDRYKFWESTDGAYTAEQSTDVPSGQGFTYSTKLVVTTADTSIAAGQYAQFAQRVESQNLQQLCYGTSAAKTITISFWVKSSKTGNYAFNLYKSPAGNTAYVYYKSFSIDIANTWEKKTITVSPTAGSTSFLTASAGGINASNAVGMEVFFTLAMGSTYQGATDNSWSSNGNHFTVSSNVNWMDSTSNNFYITGLQMEVGSKSTDFEHRSFGDQLKSCQRYYLQMNGNSSDRLGIGGYATSASEARMDVVFPCSMRAAPTISGTGTAQFDANADSADWNCSALTIDEAPTGTVSSLGIQIGSTSSMTAGQSGGFRFTSTGTLSFSAEL